MGKHFIALKGVFLVRHKLHFFGQNCSVPFSLSLDIPALLKYWQKHYKSDGLNGFELCEVELL
jgi:hypothetical protein